MDRITRRLEAIEAALSKEMDCQHFIYWRGEDTPTRCSVCGAPLMVFRLTTDEPVEASGG
jgi:hypothetical protein